MFCEIFGGRICFGGGGGVKGKVNFGDWTMEEKVGCVFGRKREQRKNYGTKEWNKTEIMKLRVRSTTDFIRQFGQHCIPTTFLLSSLSQHTTRTGAAKILYFQLPSSKEVGFQATNR